jgi:hypothetical protein
MRFMSTISAVLLLTPAVGISQVSQPYVIGVDVGSRVRIAAPVFGPEKRVGTVVSLTPDTLVLRQGANTAFHPVATWMITGLEISNGTHTRKAKGALWGLLIGAGGGAVLGYALYREPRCRAEGFGCLDLIGPDSKATNAAFSAVGGGLLGTLAGTLFGMIATETWAPGAVGAR